MMTSGYSHECSSVSLNFLAFIPTFGGTQAAGIKSLQHDHSETSRTMLSNQSLHPSLSHHLFPRRPDGRIILPDPSKVRQSHSALSSCSASSSRIPPAENSGDEYEKVQNTCSFQERILALPRNPMEDIEVQLEEDSNSTSRGSSSFSSPDPSPEAEETPRYSLKFKLVPGDSCQHLHAKRTAKPEKIRRNKIRQVYCAAPDGSRDFKIYVGQVDQ